MTNLQTYLQTKLRGILSSWDEEGIYAIAFLVSANPAQEYGECSNVTEFCVSYNTESDCAGAGALSEERWNYAFWRQNETPVILADEDDEGMKTLFAWYAENGVENIGYEDPAASYDSKMRYIGKGPAGRRSKGAAGERLYPGKIRPADPDPRPRSGVSVVCF